MTGIKIIEEKKNLLFSRREVLAEIASHSVPSHEDVKKMLSEKLSSNPELIRIKSIRGKFGAKVFNIVANVYDSKEEFKRVVKKTKQEIEKEKKALEEKKKREAEAKKAAKEAKAEEVKE